jgi:hypothetical protein
MSEVKKPVASTATATKPAGKKPAAQKPATPKPPAQKLTKLTPEEERENATSVGLGLVQYRILRAMSDGTEHSYRDIEAKTGYYKNLTPVMRQAYDGSLSAKGLIKEVVKNVDGKEKITFVITANGKKLVK